MKIILLEIRQIFRNYKAHFRFLHTFYMYVQGFMFLHKDL